ncbi:MAG: T9SS type A sorting domain-containing protein [Bacteroidia bacterium]|nr:T9SS type A sorting domain-containing protein [Bacteroidia bacterium]
MELQSEPRLGLEFKLHQVVLITTVLAILTSLVIFLYSNLGSSSDTYAGVQSITYTSLQDGDWDQNSTWDNGVPPGSSSDIIVIKHKVSLKSNTAVLGKITVDSTGEITGSYELKLGYGGVAVGELYNHGTVEITKLKIKDNNSSTPVLGGLPVVHNYGYINATYELHIGTNDGHGSLFNYAGGSIETPKVHLDNYLWTQGSFVVSGEIKNHGGTIEGCGSITADRIRLEENSNRPGTLGCIDICNGSNTPPIEIKDAPSSVGTTISSAYVYSTTTTNGAENAKIDADSTGICGINESGSAVTLPVDLIYFNASKQGSTIQLQWTTASEENNSHFVIERSLTAGSFEEIGREAGNGNSQTTIKYSYYDEVNNHRGPIYYRLKQVDFNGEFEYSPVVFIQQEGITNAQAYPNPANDVVNITKTGYQFTATLMDHSGVPIEIKKDNEDMCQFKTGPIPNGHYVVQVTSRTGKENIKVVVKH